MPPSPIRFRSLAPWALLGAAAAYLLWSRAGRRLPQKALPEQYRIRSIGHDAGQGNLLGVQPWLLPADYASSESLFHRLDGYFAQAAQAGLLGEKTVAILPEHQGTWLAVAGEKMGVYRASTLTGAMRLLLASNLPAVLRWLPWAREGEWAMATLLRMKAEWLAGAYHVIMSALAQRYRLHLVAGSLILPEPGVCGGVLRAGRGALYNVSVLYGPDGRAREPLVRKVFPTADELSLLHSGSCSLLPVFPTPAGRLGILICADAWYPACYAALCAGGAEIIAVPSFDPLLEEAIWQGYSGATAPADVDPADIGRLTQSAAWRKYAFATRIALSGARAGLNVFTRGVLWDMRLTSRTTAVCDGQVDEIADEGVGVVNLWL